MLTAEELKTLRGRGVNDTDILSEYRGYDQDAAGDIETLLKRGVSPTRVLDGLAEFYREPDAPKAEPQPDPMADKGILETGKGLLQFEGANLARGLAKTAKATGWIKTGEALEGAARAIEPAPGAYDPARSRFDVTAPSTYGYAPRAVLEAVPGLAADLAAGAVGTAVGGPAGGVAGFMGMNTARNFGGNLEARMEHQAPGVTPSGTDYAAAGASTVAEAALSRLGINPAMTSVAKGAGLKAMAQVPALIAKATAAEAAGGAAGDVVNQIGRTAGTREGLSVDPQEVGNVAALSGMTGGALRATRGVSDVTNAARFSGVDEAAGARAVVRMDATGIDATNAGNAFKRVDMARKTSDAEISDAHQIIKPLLKSKGNDTETDGTRTAVNTVLTQLKANGDVKPEHISSLRERLGDTQEGSRLLDLMEERNALNQLSSTGRFNERNETFAGGVSAHPVVDGVLNPKHYLGAKIVGGAGALGAAEIPTFAQVSLLGPALAKLAAAQAGVYGATRTLDAVTGMRNPAQEFSNRFRGLQKLSGEDLPSFRQQAMDVQAQEASTRELQAQSKAAKFLRKQEDRAWKAKEAQDRLQAAQEARQSSEVDSAWNAREAAPGRRQAQEDAMWRQNDAQHTQAIQDDATAQAGIHAGYSELLKQAVLTGQATRKLQEGRQAPETPPADAAGIPVALKVRVRAKAKAERTTEAPQSPEASPETIRITHGDQVIERPTDGVRNPSAYVAKTKARMADRQAFVDDVLAETGNGSRRTTDAMLTKLNNAAKSWVEAQSLIEDHINELPEKHWSKAWDAYLKHEGKLRGGYGERGKASTPAAD